MEWSRKMRKNCCKFIFVALLVVENVCAQGSKFSGYLANFFVYQNVRDEFARSFNLKENMFLILNRIRFRPEIDLGWESRICVEYEISSIYHSANLFFDPSGIFSGRQLYSLRFNLVRKPNLTVYHFFDRIYLRKDFEYGSLILGRQRISWGTGRVWNPTDLFNPINPADFSKIEKDGADAISAKIYLGNFTDLQFVFNPVDSFKNNNFGFRFRSNFRKFDFSLMSGYFDKRFVVGFDFAGNFFDAGVRGEGMISADRKNLASNFFKFILGFDNQFTGNIYALVEYHFNGEGKKHSEEYQLERLIKGEILNLSRNYIFAMVSYNFNPVFNISISLNQNLNDGSGFVSSNFSYLSGDNSEVGVGLLFFYGDEKDEYWYYSTSAFFRFKFYF